MDILPKENNPMQGVVMTTPIRPDACLAGSDAQSDIQYQTNQGN